jgi:hypothetical protein
LLLLRGHVWSGRGDKARGVRFWCESTREDEKWVKLSLGHFLARSLIAARIPHQSPVPFPYRHGLLCYDPTSCERLHNDGN